MYSEHSARARTSLLRSLITVALTAATLLLPARTTTAELAAVAAPHDSAQSEQHRNRPGQEARPEQAAASSQTAYLKASNAGASDNFGISVVIDGDTMVVGAPGEWGSVTSTMDSPNNAASNAGAAYVYTRSVAGTWTQAAYLKASNAEADDYFGTSVALSSDTIVVGANGEDGSSTSTMDSPNNAASNAGAAYVYTRSVAGTWTQAAYLKASNAGGADGFGGSVAVSGDTLVVGVKYEDGSIASTLGFENNDATNAGAAYVFTRSMAGTWTQAAYLKASNAEAGDEFGKSVAVDGDTIVVSAYDEDGSITSTMGSPNNDASSAGAAYVYTRSVAGTWMQAAYLKASNAEAGDYFGQSVALSSDTIVVGVKYEDGSITSTLGSPNNDAEKAGAAYVYTRSVAGTWTQAAYLKASNAEASDYFGNSVAVSGDTMMVGASGEDGSSTSTMDSPNNAASNAGAAYVYTRSVAGTWTQAAYLKAPNAEAGDNFGWSVALSGETLGAGAYLEGGSYTSTMGLPNNAAPYAGALYVSGLPSTDALLSDLQIGGASLTPAFVSTTASYAASVALEIASVVVTPTLNDASATYTVSNAAGVCAADTCALDVGANTITVTVTAEDGFMTQAYVVTITRAAAPTPTATGTAVPPTPTATGTAVPPTPTATGTAVPPTPTATGTADSATPTATPMPTPGGPTPTPTAVPPSPTPIPEDPYVSPSYGPSTTSTVSIISPAGGLTGATRVSVNGVKMFHVVRSDRKVDFTMKAVVAVAGTTVDVVLVKADNTVMTFTQSFTFVAPTTVTGTTASGVVLTTTTGVTVTVPPQTSLLPAGSSVITYAQVDTPAEPPGDVPLSFFEVSMDIDGVGVSTLTNPATLELPVDLAHVPFGQIARLYEWNAVVGRSSSVVSTWLLVPGQSYDPDIGLVTAPIQRLGTYVLVSAPASRWWFPTVTLE